MSTPGTLSNYGLSQKAAIRDGGGSAVARNAGGGLSRFLLLRIDKPFAPKRLRYVAELGYATT